MKRSEVRTVRPPQPLMKRFTIQPTIDGFAVIDDDGRPVGSERDYSLALDLAADLNHAAGFGPIAVAKMLNA